MISAFTTASRVSTSSSSRRYSSSYEQKPVENNKEEEVIDLKLAAQQKESRDRYLNFWTFTQKIEALHREEYYKYKYRDDIKYLGIGLMFPAAITAATYGMYGSLGYSLFVGPMLGLMPAALTTLGPTMSDLSEYDEKNKDFSKSFINLFLDSKIVKQTMDYMKSFVNFIKGVTPPEPIAQEVKDFVSIIEESVKKYINLEQEQPNKHGLYIDEKGEFHFVNVNDKEFKDIVKKDCMLFTYSRSNKYAGREDLVGLRYIDGKLDRESCLYGNEQIEKFFVDKSNVVNDKRYDNDVDETQTLKM